MTPPTPLAFNGGKCIDPAKTLTVAAVGDVLLHDMVQKWGAAQKDGFAGLFKPTQDIIAAADIAFANLEGPAAEGVASNGKEVRNPATRYDKSVYRGYPMFNYHPSVVKDLKNAGFDVLLTANNHALDRHQLGADRTINAIKAAGLAYTGTRHREAMSAPWHAVTPVKAAGGAFNIAWLGCTYGTNEIPDRANQVLNCYEHRDEIISTVKSLAAKPDIHAVFLVPHWGGEYQHAPDAKQTALARDVLEAGATAVIGSHSHVMQPIEKIATRDGRETVAAYSLGNFVSNQIGLPRRSAAILLLGLTPAANGKLSLNGVGWVPLWMVTKNGMYAE
ncbi:MAG: CapA family protein, partial [Dongiaceae bacterium]